MNDLQTIAALFKQSLAGMFNRWERAKPLRTGAPHASAILQPEGEWCLRRQVLLILFPEEARYPEQKPWSTLENARFLNGWLLHEKYQRLFEQFGHVIEVETSHYDDERMLFFTPDAIELFGPREYIIEIKGYKQETWDKLDELGDPPEAAWHQCNLYCHILGIEHGLILVENKNSQEVKCWCIEHDATLARPYTDRMYRVKGAATTRKIPARVCTTCNDHRAEKCPVRDFCFSGNI